MQLAASQPRAVTANTMSPNEWRPIVGNDLFTTDNVPRLAMHPDAKAIGKRIAWAFVEASLISQGMRGAYSRRV